MSAPTIQSLRARLAMQAQDPEIAGLAGEIAASWVFDRAHVAWIALEQHKAFMSTTLKAEGAKRPDYLVSWNGASVLIDVKTYSKKPSDPGIFRFALEKEEHEKLRLTQNMTGITIALIFWDKQSSGKFDFALCELNEIKMPLLQDGKNWLYIDFVQSQMTNFTPPRQEP